MDHIRVMLRLTKGNKSPPSFVDGPKEAGIAVNGNASTIPVGLESTQTLRLSIPRTDCLCTS